jgi:predicted transcriptional regulator
MKIPDSEMEVMLAVWKAEPPINTNCLMKLIGNKKGWKAPTLISFLSRLEDRGFLMSYKNGK